MIGHNKGPAMDAGVSWRRHAWGKARAELLPQLPLEVLRLRVKRASELGIDYKSYASVRAATGRDVVALLFSSNALRLVRPRDTLPEDRAKKLSACRQTSLRAAVVPPIDPQDFLARLSTENGVLLDRAVRAPGHLESWSGARARILDAISGVPADGVVLVGDLGLERAWAEAGRLAGYLPAERYFSA